MVCFIPSDGQLERHLIAYPELSLLQMATENTGQGMLSTKEVVHHESDPNGTFCFHLAHHRAEHFFEVLDETRRCDSTATQNVSTRRHRHQQVTGAAVVEFFSKEPCGLHTNVHHTPLI
jgi:hypothetical protein